MLRHSEPKFSYNFWDVVCGAKELNSAARLPENGNIIPLIFWFFFLWESNVTAVITFIVRRCIITPCYLTLHDDLKNLKLKYKQIEMKIKTKKCT